MISCLQELDDEGCTGKLRILHLNVRSIDKHHEELNVLVREFLYKPDIIVCTETWNLHCSGLYNIDGYDMYCTSGNISKADGVLIYVKESLKRTIEYVNIGGIGTMEVVLKSREGNFAITPIYRSHQIKRENFVPCLRDYLSNNSRHERHVILGDMNLDIRSSDPVVNEYLNNFSEFGFQSYVNEITRPGKNAPGTCIDHIFIKDSRLGQSYVIKETITDHYLTMVDVDFNASNLENENGLKSVDFRRLVVLAEREDWSEL